MAERKNAHANHRVERFAAIMRKCQCAGHDAKPETANRAWHHESMLKDALAQRNRAKNHRETKADLVNPVRAEQSAGRRDQPKEHSCSKAMDQA